MKHALRLLDGSLPIDGVALTGGEPLLQADFLAELLADARLPRPRLLETNGMLPERLAVVLPGLDAVSMDIKLPSNSGEPAFWAEHAHFLAVAGAKAYVKVLVDCSTDPAELARAGELIRDSSPAIPVFLQPITEPTGTVDLEADRLAGFFTIVRQFVNDVRVLPQTHKILHMR